MKKTKLSKHDEDYLVFEVLTVPTESSSNLPPRHRQWLEKCVSRIHPGGDTFTADDYSAVHPVYGMVAGFAAAKVRIVDADVYITHYGLDVADEIGALDYAHETLATHEGVAVSYHSGGYVPKMILARLLASGIRPQFHAQELMARHIDLADTVTMHGKFMPPPLALTLDALGLRSDRPRPDLGTLKDACDRGDDDALSDELRARVDEIVRLFARLWAAPNANIHGSLRARQVCTPPSEMRVA